MEFTRRHMLIAGSASVVAAGFGAKPALASVTEEAIAAFTGGVEAKTGALSITAPEIAENGNTVPIEVLAPGAAAVSIFADGNPTPNVVRFTFGALNPTRGAATRIRLAKTQNVIAVAQMEDGSFQRAQAEVKVTIGGCGG